jgi:hypothetical protein
MNNSLLSYSDRDDLKLHLELIEFYQNLLLGNNIFRAAVIVGSFAKGQPDRISDVDLITFVDNSCGKRAFNILSDKEPFNIVNAYSGEHENNFFYKKTVFDNFVSAEVHVAEKSSFFKLKKPYIKLFDHDDFLGSITKEGEAPKHEDFPALSSGGDDMGWALFDLFKWWNRGEKELVKIHLLKIAEELRK